LLFLGLFASRVIDLTVHLVRVDVVSALSGNVSNLEAASNLREEGQTSNGDGNRDLLVARKGTTDNNVEELALSIKDRASIALKLGSAASKRKARSGRFAAKLHVEAADTKLSRASHTISILVDTAVHAADSAAKRNVLLIDSIISTSSTHYCSWFW
jgi:hypothetical protein